MPFLYPNFEIYCRSFPSIISRTSQKRFRRAISTNLSASNSSSTPTSERLNPSPEDYARSIFADKCDLTVQAGNGGHGCVSFLREKWIEAGPPNGGDGGSGGNIYIQAVLGEKSLHKLARRGIIRAGRGKNGQGSSRGGQRGEDVLIQVPVGTIVREISRFDPVEHEAEKARTLEEEPQSETGSEESGETQLPTNRHKFILAPSSLPSEAHTTRFPTLPAMRRTHLAAAQPPAPINLDLSKPMDEPILLAAGAIGGFGNPHFVTRDLTRPKFATRGEGGMRLDLALELKLLADLGFVGLPNAGKSTLLRAISNSRARVGNWAFTTLQPNIGTVVLDNNRGRIKNPSLKSPTGKLITQFSIADIPGLVPDAHLDRGLGLDFLRHIERARILAFVIDLSNKPIDTLKTLWHELGEFEKLKDAELNAHSETRIVSWSSFGSTAASADTEQGTTVYAPSHSYPPISVAPISTKPWFVVAKKADIPETKDDFLALKEYLVGVENGEVPHPAGDKPGKHYWKGKLSLVPISAMRGEGVDRVVDTAAQLLGEPK